MNNRIFISGKITGDANYRTKFEQACMEVSRPELFDKKGTKLAIRTGKFAGFRPVDPCDFTFLGHQIGRWPWIVCMAVCLWHLLWCSYVYFLEDWEDSKGARIEHATARLFNKEVIYQSETRATDN